MNWKLLMQSLRESGLSQSEIGAQMGRSQAWVAAVCAGSYADLKWSDGEALRKLHAERCQTVGASDTAPEQTKEAA